MSLRIMTVLLFLLAVGCTSEEKLREERKARFQKKYPGWVSLDESYDPPHGDCTCVDCHW